MMIKNIKARIPEILKLKIGRKSDEVYETRNHVKYRRPIKLDHFLVCRTSREDLDEDQNFQVDEPSMAALAQFADQDHMVRQIPIRFGGDLRQVLMSEYAYYFGKTKVCWGDGERAKRRLPILVNGKPQGFNKDTVDVACPCELLTSGKCKPKSNLVMRLDLPERLTCGGVMMFRTTSLVSLEQLYGSLQDIEHEVGGLMGYRMWVVVRPIKVAPDGKATTVHVVHVELRASDVRALQYFVLEGRKMRAEVAGAIDYKALVASTVDEGPLEQGEIASEFYPESFIEGSSSGADVIDGATGEVVIDASSAGQGQTRVWRTEPVAAEKAQDDAPAQRARQEAAPAPAAVQERQEAPATSREREPGEDEDEDEKPAEKAAPPPAPTQGASAMKNRLGGK